MFRYRNQLRRWAGFALLLWLWAIGTSVAHACLAPQLVVPSGVEAVAEAMGHHAATADVAIPQDHAVCSSSADSDAADANCADFCVKASVSIAPLKSPLDDAQAQALLLPTVAAVLMLPDAAPERHAASDPRAAATPPLIPIPIAFLRLTR